MSERLRTLSRQALKKCQADAARIAEIITKRAEEYATKDPAPSKPNETAPPNAHVSPTKACEEPMKQGADGLDYQEDLSILTHELVTLMESLHIVDDATEDTTNDDGEGHSSAATEDGTPDEIDDDTWLAMASSPDDKDAEDMLKKQVVAGVFDCDETATANKTKAAKGKTSTHNVFKKSATDYEHIPSIPGITEDERKKMENRLKAINRLVKSLDAKDEELTKLKKEKERIRLSTIAKECDFYLINGIWRPGHQFRREPRGRAEGRPTTLQNAYTSEDLVWFDGVKEVERLTEMGYRALYDLKGRRWNKLEDNEPNNFWTAGNNLKYSAAVKVNVSEWSTVRGDTNRCRDMPMSGSDEQYLHQTPLQNPEDLW